MQNNSNPKTWREINRALCDLAHNNYKAYCCALIVAYHSIDDFEALDEETQDKILDRVYEYYYDVEEATIGSENLQDVFTSITLHFMGNPDYKDYDEYKKY